MPSAGLQIFSAGMRLQQVTPGLADIGNYHVNGKGITENGIFPVHNMTDSNVLENRCIAIETGTTWPTGPGVTANAFRSNIVIGYNSTIQVGALASNWIGSVIIGYSNTVKGGQSTTIGANCTNGRGAIDGTTQCTFSTVIGNGSQSLWQGIAGTGGSLVIGLSCGEYVDNPTYSSVTIGRFARSTNAIGGNLVIGLSANTTGSNNIFIDVSAGGTTQTNSNTVTIGNPTHTQIIIGGKDFSNGMAAISTNVADAPFTVTTQTGTVNYTSITAARVVTLPAANTVPNGFRVLVYDSSGSASGVNTITLTRAGADTINGSATVAIILPYGCTELICDGVSKWTITRSI